MTYVRSFSHIERELMHSYRDRLNHAESEEDVKKFFAQTAQEFLNRALEGEIRAGDNDIHLMPERSPYYGVAERIAASEAYRQASNDSDLPSVLKRFAEPAVKHWRHLRGHPEKTESKIRHHS